MTEKMKPSGIAWIGEIPTGWDVKRVKYVIQNNADGIKVGPFGSALTNEVVSSEEGQYKIYGQANLIRKDFNYGDNFVTEENYRRLINYEVLPDDIAVSMMGTIGKCSVVPYGIQPGIMDSHLIKIRLSKKMSPRFFEYIYESCVVYEQLVVNSKGSIMNGLNSTIVKSVFLAVPSIDEQTVIADFLDTQCAKIDSVIADIEKQIETLQKYKKSLITEAVTKGLDRSVPMKDSGVDWVGKIPAHWSVKRLKYVMNNFDSQRKPIEAQNRSQDGDVLYDYYGASGAIDKIDDYIFDETALLIGEDGANLVLRHLPLIYIATGKYWVNNHAHILRPKAESNLYFIAHQMEIIDYSLFITGSAQPKLSQENLNNVMLVVPPLEEQLEIATFLNQKVTVIDEIIENKQKQLDAIRQHKKSLIYEYVTGKKRVTEVN